jgi:2-iminobutanoate/2-iminopropanoate deaminase
MNAREFLTINAASVRARDAADLVLVDGWGFLSGLQGVDLSDDRVPLPESVEAQTRKTFANLEVVLAAAGMTKDHVVSVRVNLVEWQRFYDRFNAAYAGYFDARKRPARTCVGVSHLTRGALVEMDFVVRKPLRTA